jgi:hypothetical protein
VPTATSMGRARSCALGWIDRLPSLNRAMGLAWLAGLAYPDKFPEDICETTRAFCRPFYDVDPRRSQGSVLSLTAPVGTPVQPFFVLIARPAPYSRERV